MKIPALTSDGCQERLSSLVESVDVDLIILANPRNLYYYAGFLAPFPSLSEWGPVFLVVETRSRSSLLICHNFAAGVADRCYADRKEIWTWYDGKASAGGDIFTLGSRVLEQHIDFRPGSPRIGVEPGFFPCLSALTDTEFVDISSLIAAQQRSKYGDEIDCIRYALESTLAGHEAARSDIRAGMSELELFSLIEAAITRKAGMPIKLIGDLISGPRTLDISGGPTERIIESGDTVILDLSPVVGGYRADYTATIVLDEKPSARLLALQKTLHAAVKAGRERLRPGVRAREVYRAVKGCMDDMGFGESFTSHAGHGLGLGHPEAPFFVPQSDEELVVGDVVTLEPGCYLPGCAGRIEHVFLVTDDGPEPLSRHNTKFTLS